MGAAAYAMTYPDDSAPLLERETTLLDRDAAHKAGAKNASHIQSHPNLTNQSTDTMAIAQSNIGNRQTAQNNTKDPPLASPDQKLSQLGPAAN